MNNQMQDLFAVYSPATESYWVKGEGFAASKVEDASKLTSTEANKIELQFWRCGAKAEPISA